MTSTTNRARCLCGSDSSIDGGRRKRVVRSVGRKLARGKCPEGGANQRYDSNVEPTGPPGLKSDRLLADIAAWPADPSRNGKRLQRAHGQMASASRGHRAPHKLRPLLAALKPWVMERLGLSGQSSCAITGCQAVAQGR